VITKMVVADILQSLLTQNLASVPVDVEKRQAITKMSVGAYQNLVLWVLGGFLELALELLDKMCEAEPEAIRIYDMLSNHTGHNSQLLLVCIRRMGSEDLGIFRFENDISFAQRFLSFQKKYLNPLLPFF